MGKNFDQVVKELPKLGAGARVSVTLVSNQNDGVASYAQGTLGYLPGISVAEDPSGVGSPGSISGELLNTGNNGDSPYVFNNRTKNVKPPTGGELTLPLWQPFDEFQSDRLKLSIEIPILLEPSLPPTGAVDPPIVTFTLLSHDNVTFKVATKQIENLLFGLGSPISFGADQAVYLIAFTATDKPTITPF